MYSLFVYLLLTFASAAPQQQQSDNHSQARAVYTLYNDPSGNNILSLAVSPDDGTVSSPALTSTGGKGMLGINFGPPLGAPGSVAGPDGLFGSGAVVVSKNVCFPFQKIFPLASTNDIILQYLFTVNPGSNTLAMFKIPPSDPTHPRLIGKPVDTKGEFPTTVAYSDRLRLGMSGPHNRTYRADMLIHSHAACVVNGGAKNGVACFSVSDQSGLSPVGSLHPLRDLHTQTPPTGFPDTVSNIEFNPSSTAIFVATKGHTGPPALPGTIYAFRVGSNGIVSKDPILSKKSDLIWDFSIEFLGSDNSALVTDPTFGVSIVSITPGLELVEMHHTAIPFQAAACWSTYSPRFDAAYVMDAGAPNITIVNPHDGSIKGVIQFEKTNPLGGYDVATDRDWLYFLAHDSSIIVVNLEGNGGKETQRFSLGSEGKPNQWQGMAVYAGSR